MRSYCPSVFILKPGQHLLINKGRLHAFRKMTFDELRDDDCHAKLRKSLTHELKSRNIHRPPLCISVAFDWYVLYLLAIGSGVTSADELTLGFCFGRSFSGISAEGINREFAATLESASWCRKFALCKSLAIPETAVLKIAESLPLQVDLQRSLPSVFQESNEQCEPSCLDVVRGILPSLQYIVERDLRALKWKPMLNPDLPDAFPETSHNSVDPFGNDYFCKICSHELSNTYFHCNGCEKILLKDFNICIECFMEEAYQVNIEMNSGNELPMASHFHHFGSPANRCGHPSSKCMECTFCRKCSFGTCICHKSFQMRCRFYSVEEQQAMLERCKQVVEGRHIKYSVETVYRLHGERMIAIQVDVAEDITVNDTGFSLTARNIEPSSLNVEHPNKVISESEDELQPSLNVKVTNEGEGPGEVVKCDQPGIPEFRIDPASSDKIVDDKLKRVDDVVEISPSKKLRTDNLEMSCGAKMLDVIDDALDNQKSVSVLMKAVRSIRTDTLGFDDGNDKFLEEQMENVSDASASLEGTEEMVAAV
jgi:hypothetical protein